MIQSGAAADLALRLAAVEEDGRPVIRGELALLIDARLLVEVGAAVGELDEDALEILGAACELADVRSGDPRAALEEAIKARSSTELVLLLRTFLAEAAETDQDRDTLSALLGTSASRAVVHAHPNEGAVRGGPLSRVHLHAAIPTKKTVKDPP